MKINSSKIHVQDSRVDIAFIVFQRRRLWLCHCIYSIPIRHGF